MVVTGDPLFAVPLLLSSEDLVQFGAKEVFLCYKVHDDNQQYFNLVTDQCLSVNALFTAVAPKIDVITRVGIRAIDSNGECVSIVVEQDQCSVSIDGMQIIDTFSNADILVERSESEVFINVPNCGENPAIRLRCLSRNLGESQADLINLIIMRGQGIGGRRAHGLIGNVLLHFNSRSYCNCDKFHVFLIINVIDYSCVH